MENVLYVGVGLLFLFIGGESLIKGAVSLARRFGLPKILVSALVVGFGTSTPELVVGVGAALEGSPGLVLGNVVGSNIANILLIIGVSAVIRDIQVPIKSVYVDIVVMLLSIVIMCFCYFYGVVDIYVGLFMLLCLVSYIILSYKAGKRGDSQLLEHAREDAAGQERVSPFLAAGYSLCGLGLLVGGAYLIVEGSVTLARNFGVSEAVIGLTIVAVGTSLPELATSVVASIRKHSDVVVGNVIGSNIFNILAIMGVSSVISPVPVVDHIAEFGIWFMLGVCVLFSVCIARGCIIGRSTGVLMLSAYGAYTCWLYLVPGP